MGPAMVKVLRWMVTWRVHRSTPRGPLLQRTGICEGSPRCAKVSPKYFLQSCLCRCLQRATSYQTRGKVSPPWESSVFCSISLAEHEKRRKLTSKYISVRVSLRRRLVGLAWSGLLVSGGHYTPVTTWVQPASVAERYWSGNKSHSCVMCSPSFSSWLVAFRPCHKIDKEITPWNFFPRYQYTLPLPSSQLSFL